MSQGISSILYNAGFYNGGFNKVVCMHSIHNIHYWSLCFYLLLFMASAGENVSMDEKTEQLWDRTGTTILPVPSQTNNYNC